MNLSCATFKENDVTNKNDKTAGKYTYCQSGKNDNITFHTSVIGNKQRELAISEQYP